MQDKKIIDYVILRPHISSMPVTLESQVLRKLQDGYELIWPIIFDAVNNPCQAMIKYED